VSHSQAQASEVCAIVVTFHPDAQFPERLLRISRQVAAVIIVDNGSTHAELAMLRGAAARASVTLVPNGANLGVAAALNIGIRSALEFKFRFAMLFDQDSVVDRDMVETLLAIHNSFPAAESLGLVGSAFRTTGGAPLDSPAHESAAPQWADIECLITSGTLLSLAAYQKIGPFRAEFFIDYVDLDYCKRAVGAGFRVIQSRRALMTHSIGAPTQHRWLWMTKSTTNHSADRRYYAARNRTVMLREYGHYRMGGWALKGLFSCLKICKRVLLYEDSKLPKLRALLSGWWDGVRGHMGPRA
jgi:rhamnosyltransferase